MEEMENRVFEVEMVTELQITIGGWQAMHHYMVEK